MSQVKMYYVLVVVWVNLLLIPNSHCKPSREQLHQDEKVSQKVPVGSKHNPGTSCKNIQENGGTENRNYYIKLGDCMFQVYCDQTTAGGGWTLVYSYTFTNFAVFNNFSNAVTPRPSWNVPGDVPVSTNPPRSETDYNAMDFNLWNKLGSEFMIKSNINNWIACLEGTGSLINWRSGSLQCRLVKNNMGRCPDVVPDNLELYIGGSSLWPGPIIYKNMNIPQLRAYYFLESSIAGHEWPTHDPCGMDLFYSFPNEDNPHGNIYVR